MKILMAFIHYPVSSGTFLKRALQRAGHDVISVGPYTHDRIWGGTVDVRYAQKPDFVTPEVHAVELSETYNVINRTRRLHRQETIDAVSLSIEEIIDNVQDKHGDDWKPYLIITSDSAFTLIGESDCPHILNAQDNHVRDYTMREWDAIFCAHSWGHRMGEPNAYHCPPCYDPVVCVDMGLERNIDVLMVAVLYGNRVELLNKVAESGIRVAATTGVIYDEYAQAYNQAKISLIRSSYGDVTNRFLETAAMGCCVVADRAKDLPVMGFIDGVHYLGYDTEQEAIEKINYALESDRWRDIARAGQAVAKAHTWDARARQMLETVKL